MGLLDKLLGRSKDVASKVGLDDAVDKVGDVASGVVDKVGDVADKVGLDTAAEKVGDVASGAVDKAKDITGIGDSEAGNDDAADGDTSSS